MAILRLRLRLLLLTLPHLLPSSLSCSASSQVWNTSAAAADAAHLQSINGA
jgi:hypothetical protein